MPGVPQLPAGYGDLPAIGGSSVDADDGAIDGSGAAGRSFGPNEGVDTTIGSLASITFTFDESELGFLPTAVGLVLTDGFGPPRRNRCRQCTKSSVREIYGRHSGVILSNDKRRSLCRRE